MRTYAKGVVWLVALLMVVAMAGCRSKSAVVQTSISEDSLRHVSRMADSLVSKSQKSKHDSVAVLKQLKDSVVESIQDSVKETVVVDETGKVISRNVIKTTNRNRDHYRYADNNKTSHSSVNANDSLLHNSIYNDSSYIKAVKKITEKPANEKKSLSARVNIFLSRVGLLAIILIIVITGAYVAKKKLKL